MVRCFENDNIVHVSGKINPLEDIEIINTELILSDMELLERRIAKSTKLAKNNKSVAKELELLKKIYEFLETGTSARAMDLDEDEASFVETLDLLSYKPTIYVANVSEDDVSDYSENEYVNKVKEFAKNEGDKVCVVCAEIEQEISELEDDEKSMFLEDLGIEESGLDQLIKASYSLLNLISYLTTGSDETRAWTITDGTKAPQAAGKIHTDFEKGFIRAETINYDVLMSQCDGNIVKAKEKGLLRSEGKEYVVKDGDIITFLFNV